MPIDEDPQSGRLWRHLPQQLGALFPLLLPNIDRDPSNIAVRSRQVRHNAGPERIAEDSNDRNCGGCGLSRECATDGADCGDHRYLLAHEFAGQRRQQIIVAAGPLEYRPST